MDQSNDFRAIRDMRTWVEQRPTCAQCRKALKTCYCQRLRPFAAPFEFVILQHPNEARTTVATARMAHLSITNSKLIVGLNFKDNLQVNRLLADSSRRNVMLYPSPNALPIESTFSAQNDDSRPLSFWVLDAKWAQVPKMLRNSPNLRAMPMAKFVPRQESRFQIREQPHAAYLSTIEAIHYVIDTYARLNDPAFHAHGSLMDVFLFLVNQQIGFVTPEAVSRHLPAKIRRAAHRISKGLSPEV